MVDDMRVQTEVYRHHSGFSVAPTNLHTPHLDELAETSTTFFRAYCQVALCGPRCVSNFSQLRRPTNFSLIFFYLSLFRSNKFHNALLSWLISTFKSPQCTLWDGFWTNTYFRSKWEMVAWRNVNKMDLTNGYFLSKNECYFEVDLRQKGGCAVQVKALAQDIINVHLLVSIGDYLWFKHLLPAEWKSGDFFENSPWFQKVLKTAPPPQKLNFYFLMLSPKIIFLKTAPPPPPEIELLLFDAESENHIPENSPPPRNWTSYFRCW